jgi:hypothetical protein
LRANVPVTPPQPIPEVEQGNIRSGYVVITPDGNSAVPTPTVTYGMIHGGVVQSQAGIIPVPMTTDASLFVEVIPGIGRNLGIALANPAASANDVTLTLRDAVGTGTNAVVTVSVPPQQQLARFLTDLFPDGVIGAGFRGSLRLQSSTPLSVLGLRFSGTEFSTLPAAGNTSSAGIPTRTLTAGSAAFSPLPGVIGGANAVILPQFAMSGGWATQIALVNNTGALASGRVDIVDTSGKPMAVNLNGTSASTFTYSLQPAATFVLAPRDANGQSPF